VKPFRFAQHEWLLIVILRVFLLLLSHLSTVHSKHLRVVALSIDSSDVSCNQCQTLKVTKVHVLLVILQVCDFCLKQPRGFGAIIAWSRLGYFLEKPSLITFTS
jgi:hypothetical protein